MIDTSGHDLFAAYWSMSDTTLGFMGMQTNLCIPRYQQQYGEQSPFRRMCMSNLRISRLLWPVLVDSRK